MAVGDCWSKEDIQKLIKLYPVTYQCDLYEEFPHIEPKEIKRMVRKMCLRKEPKYGKRDWKQIAASHSPMFTFT